MSLRAFESRSQIFLDGNAVTDAVTFGFDLQSGDNVVKTIAAGFDGFADGAEMIEGDLELVVPKSGYRKDFVDAIHAKKNFRLAFTFAGKQRYAEGRLLNASGKVGVDAASSLNLKFTGKFVGSL